jgi:hypothetical protein
MTITDKKVTFGAIKLKNDLIKPLEFDLFIDPSIGGSGYEHIFSCLGKIHSTS